MMRFQLALIAALLAAPALAQQPGGDRDTAGAEAALRRCMAQDGSLAQRLACVARLGAGATEDAVTGPADDDQASAPSEDDAAAATQDDAPVASGDDDPDAVIAAAGGAATVFEPGLVEACFANARGQVAEAACVGVAAHYCVTNVVTDSYARIVGCYAAERDAWFARTQEVLSSIRERQGDDTALVGAVKAFEAWTRAFCEFEGKTRGEPVGAVLSERTQCEMRQAASLALALEYYRYY